MKHLEKCIFLNAPLSAVYKQWMRFEDFPRFMPCVRSVRHLENRHVEWCATIWGRNIRWVAEMHELVPEQSIAWRSVAGRSLSGTVVFKRIAESKTSVTVGIDYDVEGPLEWICDELLGAVDFHVAACLLQFRDFFATDNASFAAPGRVTQQPTGAAGASY